MLAPALAILIVLGYVAALWWLLRRESTVVLLALAALTCLSLTLRLFYTTDYPSGLYEDEPNALAYAMDMLRQGQLWGESRVLIPVFLTVLFQGQLAFLIGPTRWAVRLYSMSTSVLATPAIFALGRALGLRAIPSLAAGALFAVLPWSLLYGRIHLGGELFFHELLLLTVLARLIWQQGRWAEVAIGAFAQCLLLYDYWAGRAVLGMSLVAAVLARGWQRVLCGLVLVIAILGYIPYLRGAPPNMVRGVTDHIRPELYEHPIRDVSQRTLVTLDALLHPVAADGWATIRAGAMNPPLVLAVAILGICAPPGRRAVFLLAGFLGGLAPAILSDGAPSTHRMLMAYAFIPLAAACALDWIRWRTIRAAAAVIVVLIVGFQSTRLYFSYDYWQEASRWLFDWERTALIEALPPAPHPTFVVMREVGFYFQPLAQVDPNWEPLSVENWIPVAHRPAIYLIDWSSGRLRPFYESLVGSERIQGFGRAFLVHIDGRDWSWMKQHGWNYEAHCGSAVWRGQVPTLYHHALTFRNMVCGQPITHIWRGRWNGPETTLRLKWTGAAVVDTTQGRMVEQQGFERVADFGVEPESIITVSITLAPEASFLAELLELPSEDAEVVSRWERVSPVDLEGSDHAS